jgi:hypothetical protein
MLEHNRGWPFCCLIAHDTFGSFMRQKFFVPCKQPCLAQSTIAQISKARKYLTTVVIRLRENNRGMPPSIHVAALSGEADRNDTALVASKPLTLFIEYCLGLFLQQFFGSFIDEGVWIGRRTHFRATRVAEGESMRVDCSQLRIPQQETIHAREISGSCSKLSSFGNPNNVERM